MNKVEFKKTVLSKAKELQNELIGDFRTRINDIRNASWEINDMQFDMDEQGQNDTGMEMLNLLADQLNFAVEEKDFLDQMQIGEQLHEEVSICSLVVTDKKTFFPGVSTEAFQVNGEDIFGLSIKAPLYQLLKGKKAGDEVSYKEETYRIEEVY